jgi:hypothetical protein
MSIAGYVGNKAIKVSINFMNREKTKFIDVNKLANGMPLRVDRPLDVAANSLELTIIVNTYKLSH